MSMRMRPPESACTLRAQGTMNLSCALDTEDMK